MKFTLTLMLETSIDLHACGDDNPPAMATEPATTAATGAATPSYDCVFVDGEFVSGDEARLSVKANALSYGSGIFDGMHATWSEDAQQLYLLEPLAHYEREALMLTLVGTVGEATTSNVFLRRGGDWITPPVTDDILEGITRRQVIALIGAELGERVVERTVDRSELYVCDEALLCGTAVQVAPLVEVDRRPVADGRPGARTLKLMQTLAAIARREGAGYADWTTPVYADAP
jgi:branched-subunit amino acid aminotransferase/4-amino-4-deoxychorismate lyase